jgi:hypothetical protein
VNRKALNKINKRVGRQFPELAGIEPSVQEQRAPDDQSQFLLTYHGSAELPGGRRLKRIVRVVADAAGQVLRISTSR